MGSYMRLVSFLSKIKKETVVKICIGLAISATGFLQAFFIAMGISAVFDDRNIKKVGMFLVSTLFVLVIRVLIIRYQEGYTKKMAAKVKGTIRNCMLEKLMLLGPGYQNNRRSGNIQSLLTDGVESFETFLASYIPQIGVVVISIVTVVTYIITLDSTVGIIILLMAILSIIIPHFFMPSISRVMIEYWKAYAFLNAQYIDTMQGMSTLKAFGASKRMGNQLAQEAKNFAKESIRNTGISLADSSFIVLFTTIGTSVSVAIAALHMANGQLSAQALLIILFFAGECMKPLYDLNTYWHGSYLGFSVAEQLFALLDEPVKLRQTEKSAGVKFSNALPSIQIENVSFCYQENSERALKNVTININPGEMVAFVGKSGSGKSTLINLIIRFYDAQKGVIKIDGKDIREYSLEYLRSQIAVVFQDSYLFYGTVEDNIRMAKEDATNEELIEAAKAANAHEFIMKLPQGYQTIVGERGATLSGGERQRISIARAILKNAPILILDEATSSVDMASEKVIQEALERLMKNRTTLVIAHRLSTIEHAQNIFVLEDGELKGQGTHEELLEENIIYKNLVHAQERVERSL